MIGYKLSGQGESVNNVMSIFQQLWNIAWEIKFGLEKLRPLFFEEL